MEPNESKILTLEVKMEELQKYVSILPTWDEIAKAIKEAVDAI